MLTAAAILASLATASSALLVTSIQTAHFQSSYAGESVTGVEGTVTAKSTDGFWIQGEASSSVKESTGLYVYTSDSTILGSVEVGDAITLSGKIEEYAEYSDYLTATELEDPTDIKVVSTGNEVTPLVIGVDRIPPTFYLSSLDTGNDGWLSVPNNVTQQEDGNPELDPTTYGLDFWESLEGQIVTIPSPTAADFNDDYGEIFVYGNWPVTGLNARGGLTITANSDGVPDGIPGIVQVGVPLDGTSNPNSSIGMTFDDITGIIQYQYGYFYVLPTTALKVKSSPTNDAQPTTLKPVDDTCTIALGDYNVDNMGPDVPHLQTVAEHIAKYLLLPDIVFLQEIQDNSGETDDGTVDANVTLTNLVKAIASAGDGYEYSFIDINPTNDVDGGEPGGNIRQAYLWRPEKIELVPGSPVGGTNDSTEVSGSSADLTLTYNPGRIDPTNAAWDDSRKPLAAAWQTIGGSNPGTRFFTVNLQLTAKLDSSSSFGNPRPPVNAWVDQRTDQVTVLADFVNTILAKNSSANVIVGGDCNEYMQTTSVFAPFADILSEADDLANIDEVERYTYVFDGNSEQLDHLFFSKAIAGRGVNIEHIHVNNYATDITLRGSDHDPSVAQFNVC